VFLALHSRFDMLSGKRVCDVDRKIASRECASPLFSWLNGGLSRCRWGVDVAFNAPQVPELFHWLTAVTASVSELSTQRHSMG
jgi:hypothetical protein